MTKPRFALIVAAAAGGAFTVGLVGMTLILDALAKRSSRL